MLLAESGAAEHLDLGGQFEISLTHPLDGLPCGVSQHAVDIRPEAHQLPSLIVKVSRLTSGTSTGVMQHDARIRQYVSLSLYKQTGYSILTSQREVLCFMPYLLVAHQHVY